MDTFMIAFYYFLTLFWFELLQYSKVHWKETFSFARCLCKLMMTELATVSVGYILDCGWINGDKCLDLCLFVGGWDNQNIDNIVNAERGYPGHECCCVVLCDVARTGMR